MATNETAMEEAIVSSLLEELAWTQQAFRPAHFEITPAALADLRTGLRGRIRSVSLPSLNQLFLEYLNDHDQLDLYLDNPDAPAISCCREAFCAEATASGCKRIKERFPALRKALKETAARYDAFLRQLLQRVDASYDEICVTLLGGAAFRLLTGVEPDRGDSHHNGHTTCILATEAGKFVYKPHDVRIDLLTSQLIRRFFRDFMDAPAVCACEGYGFAEFIQNRCADSPEEAKQYFTNLGALAAVVQMLGSCDLHHSNVLARGIYPVVIDYELMILPSVRYAEKSIAKDFKFSLFYSSLMPSRSGETELSILFARDDGNKSAPVVDGRRKNIRDDPEAFFSGFRAAYTRCLENREALKVFALTMKGICVRHIYRSSAVYGELLKRTREHAWMQDEHLEDALFEKLSVAMKRSGAENADRITRAEVAAILRGDIPYFYSRTDSCDLYADGELVFPDFFSENAVDHLLARIDHLSAEDMAFEETLLRKAMTRVIERYPTRPELLPPVTGKQTVSDDTLLGMANQIFRDVEADAVCTPSGELCWFGPDYNMKTGMNLLGRGLMDGNAGLALFFAALHRLTDDDDLKKRSSALLNRITEQLSRSAEALGTLEVIYPNREDISFAGGMAGKLLSVYLIGKTLRDDRYTALWQKMLSLLPKIDLAYEGVDSMTGLSGLLKLLCSYDEFFSQPGIPDLCAGLGERILGRAGIPYQGRMLWKTLSTPWPISGAGHGQSGVASALYLAGKKLNRQDFIRAAMAGFAFEAEIYSEKTGAWPDRRANDTTDAYMTGYCSGAPGIGLNALRLRYENADVTLRRAVESCRKEPLLKKDFLCCGNCAVIDFLLETGRRTGDAELVAEARARMAMVIERAEREGHYRFLSHSLTPVFSPGLFYGASGIGYEMLRLIRPDLIASVFL